MAFGSGIVEMNVAGLRRQNLSVADRYRNCKKFLAVITDTRSIKNQEIICTLVDAVSKNGNLLLNVGRKPAWHVPEGHKRFSGISAGLHGASGKPSMAAKISWRKLSEAAR